MDEESDDHVLSLGLFPGEYLECLGEDRSIFRFEGAWDSSLHNSPLLNRSTPSGEHVFLTISAYLEVRLYVNTIFIVFYWDFNGDLYDR